MLWSLLRCSKQAPEVAAATQQAPEVAAATQQAPEFAALQQQALTFRSVLLQCNKLRSQEALEVAASLLRCSSKLSRSGACCVAGFSCSKQTPKLRSSVRSRTSSGACCVAGFSCSKQAPEPRSSGEAPELGACLPLQTKQTKIK